MFARLGKLLGKILGNAFYWIGWALAVIVLVQAIILSVTTGSPLIPVMLGVAGVIFWLIAIALKLAFGGTKFNALGIAGRAQCSAARLGCVTAFHSSVSIRNSAAASANFHHPVAPAVFGYRRGNGLAPAARHVRAMVRRFHPRLPRASFRVTSDRDVLGSGAGRPSTLHEPRMIEAIAAGHVVGMLLGEPVEHGTIGMAQPGAEHAKQRQHRPETDHADHHDAGPNHVED